MLDSWKAGRRAALTVFTLVLAAQTLAAIPPAAYATTTSGQLTPAQLHVLAEEAGVVRSLLEIENSLTYDAVALKPSMREDGQRIRARTRC